MNFLLSGFTSWELSGLLAAIAAIPVATIFCLLGIIVLAASERKHKGAVACFVISLIILLGFFLLLLDFGTLLSAENSSHLLFGLAVVGANIAGLLALRGKSKR